MRLAALALTVLVLAGCGGGGREELGDADAVSDAYGLCTIGEASGDGVSAAIEGYGADAACDRLIRDFAESGAYWRRINIDRTAPIICELEEPAGLGKVIVRDPDPGWPSLSERLCASFVAEGWSE